MRLRRAAWVAALGLAAACSATPKPLACPGEAVGVFRFTGTPDTTSGWCAFDGDPAKQDLSISFTATLAWGSDTEAILCLDRAEADPLRGSRSGDTFSIDGEVAPAYSATTCACATTDTERIVGGTVVRDAGGAATGVNGTLVDDVAAATEGATCEKSTSSGACGVPCRMQWTLSATR